MYRKVMIGSGFAATLVTAAYIVAVAMTASEDISLPPRVGVIAISLILGFGLVSTGAWVVQTANRQSISRDLPPVLAVALAANADANADALADAVVDRLADRLTAAITEGDDRRHSRTVAAFREIVTSELVTEQLNAAAQRIHRYGMITEASGRATVHSIRGN